MKKIASIITFLLFTSNLSAQDKVQMKIDYSTDSEDLQTMLRFEQINLAKYTFNGNIAGGNYTIEINEYKEGKLVNTDTLFDSSQDDYFKIKNDTLKLTFLTKNTNDELIFQMNGSGFSSPKMNYKIFQSNGRYAYKDFLDSKSSKSYSTTNSFPLFTIITPTVYEDGSKSYCRVAQSGIAPENLGEKFDIPHYFVATINLQ